MKKQLTSPCNECHKWKRFFCLISCKDYDQWNMDQNLRPYFTAPDAAGPDASKGEVTLNICAECTSDIVTGICPYCQINKILKANESLSGGIESLKEDLSLVKAAEQYARQEQAQAQAIVMDRDREIEELTKYRSNNFRNTIILMAFITEQLGADKDLIPALLPSGPDEEDPDKITGVVVHHVESDHHVAIKEIRDYHSTPVERCDYCKELHDPRIACPEYTATIDGVKEVKDDD